MLPQLLLTLAAAESSLIQWVTSIWQQEPTGFSVAMAVVVDVTDIRIRQRGQSYDTVR